MTSQKANSPALIGVALVEDNGEFRESLVALLNSTPGFRCDGHFRTAEAALAQLASPPPDVLLMDINLPKMSGIQCVRELKERWPEARILMLTVFADSDHIFAALKAGASGYLSKRTPPAELLRALEEVHRGGAPMSSEIAVRIVEYFQQPPSAASELANLTEREREILDHLARGFLYKEIADELVIAFDTVQWHIKNIYQKLHVRSRSEAIAKYLKR